MTDHGMADRDKTDRERDHEQYEDWDAAYLLGALSSAERHEFEEHLSGCSRCASAVAEFAAMPGLLGALPAADAIAMLEEDATGGAEPEQAPVGILTGLTARVRRRRHARTWGLGVVGALAAAAIAAAIVLPVTVNAPGAPTVSASLTQVVHSPLSASIQLTSVKWGTRIAMTCTYAGSLGAGNATGSVGSTEAAHMPRSYPPVRRYGLFVTDRAGTTTRVSSWNAGPGSTVHTEGSIDTAVSQIARVQLRSLDSGTVLMSRTLD